MTVSSQGRRRVYCALLLGRILVDPGRSGYGPHREEYAAAVPSNAVDTQAECWLCGQPEIACARGSRPSASEVERCQARAGQAHRSGGDAQDPAIAC